MDKVESARARAPRMRLSAEKREKFLELLGQTGNRRFAAEGIGVEPRLMDQRREFDPLFDRQWEEALDEAHRRLAGAAGPFDCPRARELNVVRRGSKGRLQLVACGPKRWTAETEKQFLAALAVCGNVVAAARSIGFTESSVWQRRSNWPGFARAMEEALDEAETRIEFRLAAVANDLRVLERAASHDEGEDREHATPECGPGGEKFDPDLAFRFLRWREEKRRTGRRRGRAPAPPSIEEVTERIVRKVEAIKRHRELESSGG